MREKTPLPGRRDFLCTAAGLVSAAALGGCGPSGIFGHPRPNILVITSDQQHWQAYGAADPFFDTPEIDRLARSSTVFQSAFCTTPQCSPSRASIYTGLYPHRTGVISNVGFLDLDGQRIGGLPTHFETIGSRLKTAGYHTAYFGKWHLENTEHFARHFDTAQLDGDPREGATNEALSYLNLRAAQPETPFALFVNYVNPHDIYDFKPLAEAGQFPPVTMPVPRFASWREDFSGKPAPQKLFMMEDHGKCLWGQPDVHWESYRLFYRERCRLLDVEIGRLLGQVEKLGLADNTVVVFASDHGDMDTHHRMVLKGPFMYEHMVRVPLMIRMPAALGGAPPRSVDEFAQLTDLLPTLCGLAGASSPETDGVSLVPFLTGARHTPRRNYVIAQYFTKYKWVVPIRMLRTRDFKYTRYVDQGEELYDLRNDPEEMVNLAADAGYQQPKRDLAAELDRWMTAHGDTAFNTYWTTDRENRRLNG
jgi:arylsulfatase A-like enzyme